MSFILSSALFRSLQRSNPKIISNQKELSTRARALEMPDDPSNTIPVRWIPDVPEAVSIVLASVRTDIEEVHTLREPTSSKQETTPGKWNQRTETSSRVLKWSSASAPTDASEIHPIGSTTTEEQEPGDSSVTTDREKEENLELAADALTPDAVAAKCVETKKIQALPGTRSHGAGRRRIGKRYWGPSDYLDIERRRSEGETWPQINSAYGRDV